MILIMLIRLAERIVGVTDGGRRGEEEAGLVESEERAENGDY